LASLSGGERRRVDIATLLAQDPQCAMVDEPGNHLDLKHQIEVLSLLRGRFTENGRALLLVLHDPTMALRFCDNFLLLYGDGRWQAGPAAELATAARLSELYGYPLARLEGPQGAVFSPS
jgi:iron complex transport system ATP-binding protein